eukprot:gene9892-18483_t
MSSMSAKRLPTQALPVQAVGFKNFSQPAPVPVATAAANYVSQVSESKLQKRSTTFKWNGTFSVGSMKVHNRPINVLRPKENNSKPDKELQTWFDNGKLSKSCQSTSKSFVPDAKQTFGSECQPIQTDLANNLAGKSIYQESNNEILNNDLPLISSELSYSSSTQSNVLIWGIVEKQNFKLLVDTGAAVTVISDKFYNDVLLVAYCVRRQESLNSVKTADGKEVPVIGAVSFPILVGSVSYQCHAFVVAGLAYSIVLGRVFLHEYGAVFDVRQQFVDFSGKNKINFASGEYHPLISDVRVSKTFVINAQSELVIPARLEKFATSHVVGLIEAVPKLSDRYHLYGACSMSSPNENGEVTFRLLNPSDTPVILYKGSTVDFDNSNYLPDNDLLYDSFDTGLIPEEPALMRPEETHTPLEIKNYVALTTKEV